MKNWATAVIILIFFSHDLPCKYILIYFTIFTLTISLYHFHFNEQYQSGSALQTLQAIVERFLLVIFNVLASATFRRSNSARATAGAGNSPSPPLPRSLPFRAAPRLTPTRCSYCNVKNVRLSDSNSRLSIASQALCPLSHCRAAY